MYLLKKFVGLGSGKPTKEDEEVTAVEGISRSESPNDDSVNNNCEEKDVLEQKSGGKKKQNRSKNKKRKKEVDAKDKDAEKNSKCDELIEEVENNREHSDMSIHRMSGNYFEDLSECDKSNGGNSTSQDISSSDMTESRGDRKAGDEDTSTSEKDFKKRSEDEEEGEAAKDDVDFDEFWAEFDAEEGKLRKESRSEISNDLMVCGPGGEEGILDVNVSEDSRNSAETDLRRSRPSSPKDKSAWKYEVDDFWAETDDNSHHSLANVNSEEREELKGSKSISEKNNSEKEDDVEDFWAGREDEPSISNSRALELESKSLSDGEEQIEKNTSKTEADGDFWGDADTSVNANKDVIDKSEDRDGSDSSSKEIHDSNLDDFWGEIKDATVASIDTKDDDLSYQSCPVVSTREVSSDLDQEQTTIDDFWGDTEDVIPSIFKKRKSLDESTALDSSEKLERHCVEQDEDSKNSRNEGEDSAATTETSGETIFSEGVAEPEEGSVTTGSGEILAPDVASKLIQRTGDRTTDMVLEPVVAEGDAEDDNSKSPSGEDQAEDENTSSGETAPSEDDTKIPKPPPWVEPLWAQPKNEETHKEVKEGHRRNFAGALREIEAPTRRRSVLLPDTRERILREERPSRLSESSADGEASEDDGIMDFLGKENDRAEARLAARRQARVEAREIRMRELERVQKEQQEEGSDRVFDLHATPRSSTVSPRERPISNNSYHSSRRSSEDSMEDGGLSLRDIRHELKEVEEKFRKAMIANAQLDNEKAALSYQVELLKDKLEDLEEAHSQLGREHREKCREHEALKRATVKLKEDLNVCRQCLEEREMLIADYGLVIVGGEVDEKGELTPRSLVSKQSAEILEAIGEGSLDVRLKTLAKEKNELLDEVRHIKLELEEERNRRRNDKMLNNGPVGDEIQQTLNDYRFRLQKADQETSTLQATVARLESQVIRYKSAAETSEKAEDELKIEKRKLQREHRESIARIEELETANSHLQRRMDKLKNAKSTLLKEL